jgi:hypothetical protein
MSTVHSKEIVPPESSSSSSASSSSSSSSSKVGRKSIGYQYTFAQQNRDKRSKFNGPPEDIFAQTDIYQEAVLETVVDKLSSCCSKGTRFGFGCLLSLFRSEETNSCFSKETFPKEYMDCSKRAIQYIGECRKLGVSDNPQLSNQENRDKFLQEVYRECLTDVKDLADGSSRHMMRYCIPALNQKLGRIHRPEVCLPTLLGVYGFTEYDWRICSAAVKHNPTGRVASLRHKPWKDDKLPEHSFAEIEDVFRMNLDTKHPGE